QLGHPQATLVMAPSGFSADKRFEDVYQGLRASLTRAGFNFGLYLIPDDTNGFFLVTAPERIGMDGSPLTNRFDMAFQFVPKGGFREWFMNFFDHAPEGDYR